MRLAVPMLAFAILAAAPAAAQINGTRQASAAQRDRGVAAQGSAWSGELRRIDRRTREARENGSLSRGEARSIHRQADAIRTAAGYYAANGLSDAERDMLNSQAFALRDLSEAPTRPVPRRGH
jgi:hypothetical protein